MSQPIWYTIDWLGTRQYREWFRVSRSRDLLSLLSSPQASPEPSNHRGGWVWGFSWHQICGFSTTTHSQHPTGRPVSIELGYHICGVSADATDWGIQTTQTSDPSHVFSSHHVSEQVTETRNFHSTSMLKNSIKPVNKLRKTYSLFSEKLRNSEMKEILGHGCSGVGWSLHALLSRAPSPHDCFFPPDKLSEPIFMDLYWGFTQKSYGLNCQPVVTDLRLSALLSPQKSRKF